LIKETAKAFGYHRMGAALEGAIGSAVKYAVKKGVVRKKENGNYGVG
jgi:hypothetical protein